MTSQSCLGWVPQTVNSAGGPRTLGNSALAGLCMAESHTCVLTLTKPTEPGHGCARNAGLRVWEVEEAALMAVPSQGPSFTR